MRSSEKRSREGVYKPTERGEQGHLGKRKERTVLTVRKVKLWGEGLPNSHWIDNQEYG